MKQEKLKTSHGIGLVALAVVASACTGSGNSGSTIAALPAVPLSSNRAAIATSVNRYLWAASLETLNFMPITSADPIGGVIISEWFSNPELPNERFKTNVFILDDTLRADALRVSIFKQRLTRDGWVDAGVNPATAHEVENAILTRARQLRFNSLGEK